MLKTIDLAATKRAPRAAMSYAEYKAELAKPRSERRGLARMPSDMCCVGESAVRMGEYIARVSSANAAARACGMANARNSATNR